MIRTLLLAAAVLQAAPVPPPLPQATADCARPTYAIDMFVCGDPVLRALDDRLKLALADPARTIPDTPMIENQNDWFRRSRRCAFQVDQRACVAAAYQERLTALALVEAADQAVGQCRLADGTTANVIETVAGAALVRGGHVIAAGVAPTPAWQAFVVYRRNSGKISFRDSTGKPLATCGPATWKIR